MLVKNPEKEVACKGLSQRKISEELSELLIKVGTRGKTRRYKNKIGDVITYIDRERIWGMNINLCQMIDDIKNMDCEDMGKNNMSILIINM